MAHAPRILVADGDLKTVGRVSECMRRLGFVNLLEMSAGKAISRARTERPEVILLGLEFSDRASAGIISELKSDGDTRDIPVLLMSGENIKPQWSDDFITRFDGIVQWPFEDAQIDAHVRAALRLGTMRAELNRRSETLRHFGEESADEWRAESAEGKPHILLARGENSCGDAAEDALKGFALLQAESLGNNISTALSDSDIELVVIVANGDLQAALDICDDLRRNPVLFHMPILAICSTDPEHIVQAYRHGATAAYSLPFDGDELRARVTMGVKLHRLRGYMLEAYRTGGQRAVSDSATGLYSAEFLRRHLQTLLDDALRWDKNLSLNVVAVPEIEHIRNEYGDKAAAQLLKQLGGMISRLVRGEDLCARLDDSTFCIALPECTLEATSPAEKRLAGVLGFTEFALLDVAKPVIVHPRIGCAEFKPGDTVDGLIDRATSAALTMAAA